MYLADLRAKNYGDAVYGEGLTPAEFTRVMKQSRYFGSGDVDRYSAATTQAYNILPESYVPVTAQVSAPVKVADGGKVAESAKPVSDKEPIVGKGLATTPAPVKEQAKPVKVVTAKDAEVKPVLKQIMDANTNLLSGTNPDAAVAKYMDTVTRELKKRGYQLDTGLYAALLKKATEAVRMSVAQRNSSRS